MFDGGEDCGVEDARMDGPYSVRRAAPVQRNYDWVSNAFNRRIGRDAISEDQVLMEAFFRCRLDPAKRVSPG